MHTTYIPIQFDMVPLTVFFLSFALIACVVGLFYSHYRENWLQHAGMIAVGLASALKIEQTITRGFASAETALLAGGIACFAGGVAWKVWSHQRDEAIAKKYQKPKRAKAH